MYNNYNYEYTPNINKKLLYVIVFVAALFVAALSGTFAYFQASANNSTSITGTIANVGINLSVTKLTSINGTATNGATLIPFNLISSSGTFNSGLLTNASTATPPGAFSRGCIDTNGYTACDIFKIAISANNQIKVNGYLKIGPGTDKHNISNIKWMLLGPITTTSVNNIENITSSIYNTGYMTSDKTYGPLSYADYNAKNESGKDTYLGNSFTNSVGDTITTTTSYYYILVWLEDTEDAQEDDGTYTGTVTFRGIGETEGQITAKFG